MERLEAELKNAAGTYPYQYKKVNREDLLRWADGIRFLQAERDALVQENVELRYANATLNEAVSLSEAERDALVRYCKAIDKWTDYDMEPWKKGNPWHDDNEVPSAFDALPDATRKEIET